MFIGCLLCLNGKKREKSEDILFSQTFKIEVKIWTEIVVLYSTDMDILLTSEEFVSLFTKWPYLSQNDHE